MKFNFYNQHPYYQCDIYNGRKRNYYQKYIKNQIGGYKKKNGYDFEEFEGGFFLGMAPHCVEVHFYKNEANIESFLYHDNCFKDIKINRNRRTDNLMKTTLKIIKEKSTMNNPINIVYLTDNSMKVCGYKKYLLYKYYLLYHGITYYMKYEFRPVDDGDSNNISKINNNILGKTININDILFFIKNNEFDDKINKSFYELCSSILGNNEMNLRDFLEKIKMEYQGVKACQYFFSFISFLFDLVKELGIDFFGVMYYIDLKNIS